MAGKGQITGKYGKKVSWNVKWHGKFGKSEENSEKIWKYSSIFSLSFHYFLLYFPHHFTIQPTFLPYFRNKSHLNIEMIWKIWKKGKLNSGKIWKIWKKSMLNSEKIWKMRKKHFFHIVHIISQFNLIFFRIFHIFSLFNLLFIHISHIKMYYSEEK
jgi:hypothetical protein